MWVERRRPCQGRPLLARLAATDGAGGSEAWLAPLLGVRISPGSSRPSQARLAQVADASARPARGPNSPSWRCRRARSPPGSRRGREERAVPVVATFPGA
ncbi:Hypothetical predicted protein [Podarcis lilfordi]|uniref:Uncharacterized protein n=1 Tax=Podarcis lilfordi TaxID=74358 RepID=A0AA35LE15_9SAUR|nr:Hypothetical predicted protein [Podarcis lilfordi]